MAARQPIGRFRLLTDILWLLFCLALIWFVTATGETGLCINHWLHREVSFFVDTRAIVKHCAAQGFSQLSLLARLLF
jgi:hypothetical protein